MGTFVGPHTAETQRHADAYTQVLAERDPEIVAHQILAGRVAEAVLDGEDPWPSALAYDACRRDARWTTYRMLTDDRRYVQADDGYVKAGVGS